MYDAKMVTKWRRWTQREFAKKKLPWLWLSSQAVKVIDQGQVKIAQNRFFLISIFKNKEKCTIQRTLVKLLNEIQ